MKDKRRPKNFRSITESLAAARTRSSDNAAEQIATIEQQIAAISRGDFEAALRHASSDVELEIYAPQEFPFIKRAHGAGELRAAIEHNFGSVEDQQPVIANVVVQGNVVVLFGSERGRIRSTGADYHVEFVHRFTFDDGALRNIRIIVARAA